MPKHICLKLNRHRDFGELLEAGYRIAWRWARHEQRNPEHFYVDWIEAHVDRNTGKGEFSLSIQGYDA